MINQNRLKNLLVELIKIDSLSRKERNIALRLQREMESRPTLREVGVTPTC